MLMGHYWSKRNPYLNLNHMGLLIANENVEYTANML